MKETLDRLDRKLDVIDSKLDRHLERISKAEVSIIWLRWALGLSISFSGAIAFAITEMLKRH